MHILGPCLVWDILKWKARTTALRLFFILELRNISDTYKRKLLALEQGGSRPRVFACREDFTTEEEKNLY